MIVVSDERYVPTTPGVITLQDADGVYYYVHKTLYEQATILEDRYGESIETLQKLIGGNPDFVAIEKFVKYVPRPVSIMGYFLALLTDDIEDFEDAVGALDAMSSAVNLRNLIKQPEAIRQTIRFGMSIRNEYKDSWEHFLQTCYSYEEVKAAMSGSVSRQVEVRQQPATTYYAPEHELEPEEEELDDDDPVAKALAALDALKDKADAQYSAGDDENEKASLPESEKAPIEKIPDSLGGNGLEAIAKARRRAL